MHDREPAEIELIPQRHPGVLRVEDMFRVGGGKGAEVRSAKLQRGTFLHQLDALLRDAVLMGQSPAAGGENKLCFVVLCKAAQGVLCHVVGVAVGAEDKVRPQLPRRKGGRIAAAGAVGAGQVAEHRVDADDGVLVLENEPALADRPDGQLAGGEPGG